MVLTPCGLLSCQEAAADIDESVTRFAFAIQEGLQCVMRYGQHARPHVFQLACERGQVDPRPRLVCEQFPAEVLGEGCVVRHQASDLTAVDRPPSYAASLPTQAAASAMLAR